MHYTPMKKISVYRQSLLYIQALSLLKKGNKMADVKGDQIYDRFNCFYKNIYSLIYTDYKYTIINAKSLINHYFMMILKYKLELYFK